MDWTKIFAFLEDHIPVPGLDAAFQVLEREVVPYALSYLLLFGLAVLLIWLFARLSPLHASLKKAHARLLLSGGPEAFADNFEEFSNWISDNRHLKDSWREFDETLILPEGSGAIQNTSRPESYFDSDSLCARAAPIRVFQAVPGYFVTIGLMFTFLGLLAALHSARGTVVSEDIEAAKQALATLLGAATLKFMTSLVGLFCSILFAVVFRWYMGQMAAAVERFNGALEGRLFFIATAQIAKMSHQELEVQTSQLQRFNTDFAVSVANALESKLTVGIANAMAPISGALTSLSEKIGNVNEGAIRDMVQEFQGTLRESIDSQMRDLAGVLEESRTSLQGLAGLVDDAGTTISARLVETSDTLANSFGKAGEDAGTKFAAKIGEAGNILTGMSEDFRKSAESVSESLTVAGGKAGEEFATKVEAAGEILGRVVGPFGKHLEEVTQTLDGLDRRLQQQSENLSPLLSRMDEITRELATTASHMDVAAKPLEGAATGLIESSESLREALSGIGGISQNISVVSDTLRSSVEQLTRLWDNYSGRFEGIDSQMINSFRELDSGLQRYRQQVDDMITGLDSSMSRATGSLGSAIQAMQESIEDFGDLLEQQRGEDN